MTLPPTRSKENLLIPWPSFRAALKRRALGGGAWLPGPLKTEQGGPGPAQKSPVPCCLWALALGNQGAV